MKTARIISKAVIVFLSIFAMTTFASAQKSKTVSATTTTSENSSQKVNININGNKLSLKMDDDVFDLDMVFDFDATDVIAAITDELGQPMQAGRFQAWDGNGYDIKVKDGNLDVFINRNTVSPDTHRQMENIFKELFKDLDLDINIGR